MTSGRLILSELSAVRPTAATIVSVAFAFILVCSVISVISGSVSSKGVIYVDFYSLQASRVTKILVFIAKTSAIRTVGPALTVNLEHRPLENCRLTVAMVTKKMQN